MSPLRAMRLVGAVELVTLVVMLVNLATVHHPTVASVLGPLHGLAYLTTVIIAVLLMNGRHMIWLLALVPGIGGLLAARAIARPAVPDPHDARDAQNEAGV